jgi:CRP-like cAMP-binding protein
MLLAVLGAGEFFGEGAIFEQQARSATVHALSETHVLTVDKRNLLRQIADDPTLAFHLVQHMSARIRALTSEVAWLTKDSEARRAASAPITSGGEQISQARVL